LEPAQEMNNVAIKQQNVPSPVTKKDKFLSPHLGTEYEKGTGMKNVTGRTEYSPCLCIMHELDDWEA
jgi:hypothetical protein